MILNASKEGRYLIVGDIPPEHHERLSVHIKRCINDFVNEILAFNEAIEQHKKDTQVQTQGEA